LIDWKHIEMVFGITITREQLLHIKCVHIQIHPWKGDLLQRCSVGTWGKFLAVLHTTEFMTVLHISVKH